MAQIIHIAARVEDVVHDFREKRARASGRTPTVVPYTSYGAPGWARILCRVMLAKPTSNEDEVRYRKIRGWRSFTSVSVTNAEVTVEIAGVTHTVTADRGGVVDVVVQSPVPLEPGWHTITLRTDHRPGASEGDEVVEAPLFVVDPAVTFGLISDIDDTVMVTALPRPFLAAWNTFVLDEHARRPVPGMAVLYERLLREHPGAPVFYLSTGAWNVAPTLTRFLSRNLYPRGPLLLTDWGPTHDRWFRSGREHKTTTLARLAGEFPDMHWLLIGDDGQHDVSIYGAFSAEHADNVDSIAIRQLSPGEAVLAGGRSIKSGQFTEGARWVYAPDGAGLAKQLLSE